MNVTSHDHGASSVCKITRLRLALGPGPPDDTPHPRLGHTLTGGWCRGGVPAVAMYIWFFVYGPLWVGEGRADECFGNWQRGPFGAFGGREAGTGAVRPDAEVFTAVEVSIGSMPTLAE